MMMKLFEGLREIIQLQQRSQESMLSEKKFLEETFSRFNPYLLMSTMQMHQMNMNPSQITQLRDLQQQQITMLNNMQPHTHNHNTQAYTHNHNVQPYTNSATQPYTNSATQQLPTNIHALPNR